MNDINKLTDCILRVLVGGVVQGGTGALAGVSIANNAWVMAAAFVLLSYAASRVTNANHRMAIRIYIRKK